MLYIGYCFLHSHRRTLSLTVSSSSIFPRFSTHGQFILRPNWGPNGQKNFFLLEPQPPYLRVWMTVSPYLKVWIRYWFQLHRLSFPYDHEQCISYYRSFILPGLNGKNAWLRPWRFCHPPHARQVVYFCALTQGSSKQYHCPAARKRKADECKVRDKCDQGAKKVRMGVTDLNNKYDGVIDQASGGVTAVIYTLWQSLFRLHPGNGCLTIETR